MYQVEVLMLISTLVCVSSASARVKPDHPAQSGLEADRPALPSSPMMGSHSMRDPLSRSPQIRTHLLPRMAASSVTKSKSKRNLAIKLVDAFPKVQFNRPIYFTSIPDASNRLVVVQQDGRILALPNQTSAAAPEIFLDISHRVHQSGGEEGLLGLAFDPDYKSNQFYYVNYTTGDPRHTVIARYQGNNPKSEKILLEIPQPYANHNGGALVFGRDRHLYIATGDGGAANDPQGHGQNLESLLGKILRIDPHTKSPYKIPADNPFVGVKGARDEIWAYGLRNPWRISFDRLTGDLWAGDVGQNQVEEIDQIVKGGNYGWRECEGHLAMPKLDKPCPAKYLPPVYTYLHNGTAKSVTGGYVYRGNKLPSLRGAYIYADFIDRQIWALIPGDTVQNIELAIAPLPVSSFGEDGAGEIFVVGYADGKGRVWKLTSSTP